MTRGNWRTPGAILLCSGIILTIALGTRHNFGLYLQPVTMDLGIGREVFAFAIALQNLFYGISQPLTGMIVDKYGAARVLVGGSLLYIAGLVLMSFATPCMVRCNSLRVSVWGRASHARRYSRDP